MPQLPFQPAPGLFTDTSTFSGKGGWIACSNVRFYNGRWQVIGGWRRRNNLQLSSTTNAILEWKVSDGTSYIAWGGNTSLQVETSSTLYNIAPAASSGKWSFANYGDTLIANVSGGKIYQWSLNTAVVAAQVTNAPVAVTCVLVTDQRQLLAFGCNEEVSGTFNGRCIRGSDLGAITSWTTSATNNSFENILDGATSAIVTARIVGRYVTVWTSTDLWMGEYIGNPSQTYRFDKVASLCGAISLNGVVVVGATAYWVTPDLRFMAWSPGAQPTEIACPIINFLRGSFSTTASLIANTFAAHVAKFNEVWFHYDTTSGGVYPGSFVAVSLADGHWFKGQTERRAMRQGLSGLLAALNNGNVITCESGLYGEGNSVTSLVWSIQSSDIYADSGQRRVMLRSLRTDFSEQSGDVTVTVSAKDYPNDAYRTVALTATTVTKKKDFRKSGRLVSVTFSGTDGAVNTNTFARQGLCVFDTATLGER